MSSSINRSWACSSAWSPIPAALRIALIFLLLTLLLIYFPFLITPDSKARGRGGPRSQVGGALTLAAKPVGFLSLGARVRL